MKPVMTHPLGSTDGLSVRFILVQIALKLYEGVLRHVTGLIMVRLYTDSTGFVIWISFIVIVIYSIYYICLYIFSLILCIVFKLLFIANGGGTENILVVYNYSQTKTR